MGRDAADRRIRLVEVVRRHADEDDRLAFGEVERQLGELGLFDERDAVLRQEVVKHPGVLGADEDPHHAQNAGRHAEVEADAVGVPGARAGAGTDEHLVPRKVRHDLVDQGKHSRPSSVDEALASNLDDVGLGQNLHRGLPVELRQPCLVGETALDERLP